MVKEGPALKVTSIWESPMYALVVAGALFASPAPAQVAPQQQPSQRTDAAVACVVSPSARPNADCLVVTQAPASAAALDPHAFGAVGNCVTDDTRAYRDTIAAARAEHREIGGYGCFRITAPLDNAGVAIRGAVMPYTRNSLAPATWGHVLAHDSGDLPLFAPQGDGWSLENVVLYDPAQTGAGSAPIVRPPMIDITGQSVDWTITRSVIVNAYDFLHTSARSIIGDARIASNRIYAVRRVYDLHGASPEVIFESGNIYSPGVFQYGAVFAHDGMLANWTGKNGSVHAIDTGDKTVDGWSAANNFTYGYRDAFAIASGALNVSVLTGELWDQVAQPVSTSGTGGIDVSISGGSGYIMTHGDTARALPAFRFSGTGYHKISITGFQGEYAAGGWCEVATSVPVFFVLQGGSLGSFGRADGAKGIAACRIDGAGARVTFKPGYVLGSTPSTIGLQVLQAVSVVSDTTYDTVGTPIAIAAGVSRFARIVDRSVTLNTQGLHAYANAASPEVLTAAGSYDKP